MLGKNKNTEYKAKEAIQMSLGTQIWWHIQLSSGVRSHPQLSQFETVKHATDGFFKKMCMHLSQAEKTSFLNYFL